MRVNKTDLSLVIISNSDSYYVIPADNLFELFLTQGPVIFVTNMQIKPAK